MEILTYFLCLLITRAACDWAGSSDNVESTLLKHSVIYESRDISKSFDIFGSLNPHRSLATPSDTEQVLETQNTGKPRGYQGHEIPLYPVSRTALETPDDNNNGFQKPVHHHSTHFLQKQPPQVDISQALLKSIRNDTKRHLGEPTEVGTIKLSESRDSSTRVKEGLQSSTELYVANAMKKSPQTHSSHLKQQPVQANTGWYIKNAFKLVHPILDFQPGVTHDILGPVRLGNAKHLRKPDGVIQAHELLSHRTTCSVPTYSHFSYERYFQRPFPFLPLHDALMPIQHDRVRELRRPVSFGTTHNLQKPDGVSSASHHSSHTTSKLIKTSPEHYFQRFSPFYPNMHDVHVSNWPDHVTELQKPAKSGSTRKLQRPHDVNKAQDELTFHHISHPLPKSTPFSPEVYTQRPLSFFPVLDVRSPIQIDRMPKLRAPVGSETIHDLRKPEDVNQIHDFRNHLHLSSNQELDHLHNLGHVPKTVRTVDSQWPEINEMDGSFQTHILEKEGMRNLNLTNRRWKSFNVYSSHKVQKREAVSDVSNKITTQESHFKNSIIHDQDSDFGKTLVIDQQLKVIPSHHIEKSIQSNTGHSTKEIPKFDLTHDRNDIMPHDSLVNFEASVRANHVLKQIQLNSARGLREPVQINISDNIRQPVQPDSTRSLRKRSQHYPYHNIRQPVRLDPSRSLREPMQLNSDHNMRQPVQLDSTHNLRKPVQVHPSHNLRRPVRLDATHDLRTPVKVDPTHDLRKPVKLMESHDLRWPVVEEVDHDLRNPIPEDDIFRNGYKDEELGKIIREYIFKTSKKSFTDDKGLDPLSKLLYDDEYLLSKCGYDKLDFKHREPSIGKKDDEKTSVRLKSEYKRTFSESIKACGIPFNQSTDALLIDRKSTKWPWMVSLQQYIFNRFWHKCAGSLLNNLWVITAAHCVESRPKWDFLLRLGMDDPEHNRHYVERFVDRISIHPKFNILNLDHDIALLRMDSSVTFQPNISPICLPWKPDEIENKKAVALGWRMAPERSKITDGSSQEKTVPVLTNKECEVMFSETGSSEGIQKSFLCASFQKGRQDSCIGDSGGPLAILDDSGKWLLAGLYSWGKTCATPNQPEVYIRISRYSDWIEDIISCYEDNISLL